MVFNAIADFDPEPFNLAETTHGSFKSVEIRGTFAMRRLLIFLVKIMTTEVIFGVIIAGAGHLSGSVHVIIISSNSVQFSSIEFNSTRS